MSKFFVQNWFSNKRSKEKSLMNMQNHEMNIDMKEEVDQNTRKSKEFFETIEIRDDGNLSTNLDEEEVFSSEKTDGEISDSVMEDSEISCSELDDEEVIRTEKEDGEISDSVEEDGENLCPQFDEEEVISSEKEDGEISDSVEEDGEIFNSQFSEELSSLVKDNGDISSTVKKKSYISSLSTEDENELIEDLPYVESILHSNYVQLNEQISINQHTSFKNTDNLFEVENMLNAMKMQFALEKEQLEIKIKDLQEEIKILLVSF